MRISDWSSDVCSADLQQVGYIVAAIERDLERLADQNVIGEDDIREFEHKNSLVALGAAIRQLSKLPVERDVHAFQPQGLQIRADHPAHEQRAVVPTVFRPMNRSEEHTSELQSLMRTS